MKKTYEYLVILNGMLSEEERQKAEKQIDQIFSKAKAEIKKKIDFGKRKLGYPIKKVFYGVYLFFYIEVKATDVKEIQTLLGYEATILKNIFFAIENWEKEAELLEKFQTNPQTNVEKLVKLLDKE